MKLTSSNVNSIVARLDSWRCKAAAAGRDDDCSVLDAVIGFIRQHHPIGTVDRDSVRRGFVPTGTPVVAASAQICPYQMDGACQDCAIDRARLFSVPSSPGRAFACFALWVQAMEGRNKSFKPE